MKRLVRLEPVIWSAIVGAVWNVVLCSLVAFSCWQLLHYSLPVGIVWAVSAETMLWRGAVIGAIVGWWLGSNRAMLVASGSAGLLLAVLHSTASMVIQGFPLQRAIDPWVTLHFMINGVLTGTVTGLLARHALKGSSKRNTEVE